MDLQKVCRLCLRIPKQPINLFENQLLEKIEAISSIQVNIVNEFSDQICIECLRLINISYKFRLVIINSDNDLNTRLKTLKQTNYLTKRRTDVRTNNPINSTKTNNTELHFDRIKESDPDIKQEIEKVTEDKSVERNHECHTSKKNCSKSKALKADKSIYHARRIVCNICGQEFYYYSIKKHIQAKHTRQPSRCNECGKICIHPGALIIHKREHHAPKEFACHFCGKTFSQMSRLTRHFKYHNKEIVNRRKTCSICGKIVASIERHMLTHSGGRPYVCTYCNKGLTSAYALKIHTRSHTNERPYACTYCDASYPQPVSLRTHLKNKHGIIRIGNSKSEA